MNKFAQEFLFSFLVALPMVMMDALWHLATNTVVHINYVAVKFTLIFLTLFLTSYWVGKGFNQGLFATIAGPALFYIYYLFADPTINREVFKIDESFGYIFLHIAVFVIAYAVVYNLILHRKSTKEAQRAGKAFIWALCVVALDAGYQLERVQLATRNEELVAAVLKFDLSLYLTLALIVVGFLIHQYGRMPQVKLPLLTLAGAGFIFLMGGDWMRTIVGILSAGIPAVLLYYYRHHAQHGGVHHAH